MIKSRALFLAFATTVAFTPVLTYAASTGIKMLPPIQSGTADDACWEHDKTVLQKSEGNKLLSWDGKTAIKCNKNTTISSDGDLGVGTSEPQAKLDVRGDAIISGTTGIGTASPAAKLDVVGDLKVGTDANICTAANAGTMRYDSAAKKIQYCNESAWVPLGRGAYNCAVQYTLAPGSTYTYTCPAGQRVLSGTCWRNGSGVFGGSKSGPTDLATTSLNSFTCNIASALSGIHVYVTCCNGINTP